MAKVNTNALNDLAASLEEFPTNVKEEIKDETLDYVSEKIGAKYEEIVNASSRVSNELIELASSAEEIEDSIASSANDLESVDGIPEMSSSSTMPKESAMVVAVEYDGDGNPITYYGGIDKFFMESGTEYGNNQGGLANEIEDSVYSIGGVMLKNLEYEFDEKALQKLLIKDELKQNTIRQMNGEAGLTVTQIESNTKAIVDRDLQILSTGDVIYYSSDSRALQQNQYPITDLKLDSDLFLRYFTEKSDGDLGEACNQYNDVLVPYGDPEFLEDDTEGKRLCDLLIDKGMNKYDAISYLESIDSTGVCTYATRVNQILATFKDDPEGFEKYFGFPMYVDTSDGRQLNSNELMLDLYTYVNLNYASNIYGDKQPLLKIDDDGDLSLNDKYDTKNQVYLQYDSGYNGLSIFNEYLQTKGLKLTTDEMFSYFSSNFVEEFPDIVRKKMEQGYLITLEIDSPDRILELTEEDNSIPMKLWPLLHPSKSGYTYKLVDVDTGEVIADTSAWDNKGHSMFVTGTNDEGVIVATWGQRALIKEEDFRGNWYGYSATRIERIDE